MKMDVYIVCVYVCVCLLACLFVCLSVCLSLCVWCVRLCVCTCVGWCGFQFLLLLFILFEFISLVTVCVRWRGDVGWIDNRNVQEAKVRGIS